MCVNNLPNINFGNYQNSYYINNSVSIPPSQVQQSKYPVIKEKEGLSKGEKWGIGLGLTALAATGIYLATKGRVEIKKFIPANDIKEAEKFAQKKLGIVYVDGKKANLDMMNTVNEWMFNEKFIHKNKIPEAVYFYEKELMNALDTSVLTFSNGIKANALGVNIKYINEFGKVIDSVFSNNEIALTKLIRKNSNNKYEIANPKYECENLTKFINKLNNFSEKSSFKNKMEIYNGLSEAISYNEKIKNGLKNAKMDNFTNDSAFIHEICHVIHRHKYKDYDEIVNNPKNHKLCKEFQNSAKYKNIAGRVSSYAKTDPLEFVAEVYSKRRKGIQFDEDVMNLYKKYQGPKI